MSAVLIVGSMMGIAMHAFARWLAPEGARLPQIPAVHVLVAGLVVLLLAALAFAIYGPLDAWLRELMDSRPRVRVFGIGGAVSLATLGLLLVAHGTWRIIRRRT